MSFTDFVFIGFAVNLFFGALSAYAASRWGREPFGWLLVGLVLGPIAVLLLIAMHMDDVRRAGPSPAAHTPVAHPSGRWRVLIPSDGSPSSNKAVQHVIDHLAKTTREATVVSVLPLEMAGSAADSATSSRRRLLEQEVQSHVGGACAALSAAGIDCNEVIRFGKPAEEIIRLANEGDFDLIVMGRHGRGPVAKLLLGSVSDKVVREAGCAVTVVG